MWPAVEISVHDENPGRLFACRCPGPGPGDAGDSSWQPVGTLEGVKYPQETLKPVILETLLESIEFSYSWSLPTRFFSVGSLQSVTSFSSPLPIPSLLLTWNSLTEQLWSCHFSVSQTSLAPHCLQIKPSQPGFPDCLSLGSDITFQVYLPLCLISSAIPDKRMSLLSSCIRVL